MISKNQNLVLKNYDKLIRFISNHYVTIFFDQYQEEVNQKIILLRHDIDYSVSSALEIAEIENKHNLRSTFFINIHSDFYNFFEKKNISTFKQIISMGHSIGIHFDSNFWNIKNKKNLVQKLEFEKNIIDKSLGITTNVFSFHNPNKFILSFKDFKYAGLINAYSDKIMKSFKYCSDSNGYWRHEIIFNLAESLAYDKLHFLTHPGWWTKKDKFPREKIIDKINDRSKLILKDYDQNLKRSKRKNLSRFFEKIYFVKNYSNDIFFQLDKLWNDGSYLNLYRECLKLIEKRITEILRNIQDSDDKGYLKLKSFSFKNSNEDIIYKLKLIDKNSDGFKKIMSHFEKKLDLSQIFYLKDETIKDLIYDKVDQIRELYEFELKKH